MRNANLSFDVEWDGHHQECLWFYQFEIEILYLSFQIIEAVFLIQLHSKIKENNK